MLAPDRGLCAGCARVAGTCRLGRESADVGQRVQVVARHRMKREDIIGSLEVGKRADLIVLGRDLFQTTT